MTQKAAVQINARPISPRFGPFFFWLLFPATFLAFNLRPPDASAGGVAVCVMLLFWLYALVGTLLNVFRWWKLNGANRIALVLLGAVLFLLSFIVFRGIVARG